MLTMKNERSTNEIWKARYVVQSHNDSMKSSIVHNIAVARQFFTKVIISSASMKRFRLFPWTSIKIMFKVKRIGKVRFVLNNAKHLFYTKENY